MQLPKIMIQPTQAMIARCRRDKSPCAVPCKVERHLCAI